MLLRTDDVDRPTDNFKRFLEITKDVPVVVAAQPFDMFDDLENITQEMKDNDNWNVPIESLIKSYKNVTVCQHGWDHKNYAPEGEKKNSYPVSRDVDECIAEILNGKKSLEKHFGDQFYPVFIPPWNRFGHNKQILSEIGFVGMEDDEGTLDMQYDREWIDETYFWRKVETDDTIHSLMFHHDWMNDENFQFLENLVNSGVILWKNIRESS